MNDVRFVLRRHRRPWGTRFTFVLLANNSEPILSSEPYTTREAAKEGIDLVKLLAPGARVVDMTA